MIKNRFFKYKNPFKNLILFNKKLLVFQKCINLKNLKKNLFVNIYLDKKQFKLQNLQL